MNSLVFVLAVTFGSVALGYVTRLVPLGPLAGVARNAATISKVLKIVAIFVLNPVPVVNAFWRLSLDSGLLLVFPFLGIVSVTVAGSTAIGLNYLFGIPPRRAASVFVASAFTNIMSLGGLIAFVFFGHDGYALVPLFNSFISLAYYAVGYPLSHHLSLEKSLETRGRVTFSSGVFRERPYLLSPVIAILFGLALNVMGVPRPVRLDTVSGVLIPLISAIIGYSIGLSLRFSRIRAYRKEIALVSAVKFIVVPAVIIPIGVGLGLPSLLDGVAFKVLVVLSVMPVAFNALIPPVVYEFDLDLANSAWVVTTLAIIPLLPVLYVLLILR